MLAPVDSDLPKWAAWFADYEGDGRRGIGAWGRNSGVVVVWRAARAAERPDAPAVLGMAHGRPGRALNRRGLRRCSPKHSTTSGAAPPFAEQAGNLRDQADAHHHVGSVLSQLGDDERALEHREHSLRLHQRLGSPREADAPNAAGWCHAQLGDHEKALACCEAAFECAVPPS